FLILDTNGKQPVIVYDHRPSVTKSVGLGSNLDDTLQRFQQAGYLYSEYSNQTTGWNFVYFVETKALLIQSDRIGTVTMLIAVLMAGIALIISFIVSGSITRPLLQLKKMIVDW